MGKIQAKVEEMKRDLELAIREKMELEARKAELISELEVCSMRLENLGEVNSSCKEKLGELEVCKSEIGRLADVVEKRFSQVKEENEEEQQLRSRAVLLEESMQEAESKIEKLKSELEECRGRNSAGDSRIGELE